MDIEVRTWLYDIVNAINEIESFLADNPKDFAAYQNDIRTKRAVERNIEIIGEATNRVLHKDTAIGLSNAKRLSIHETELSMVTILYQMTLSGVL